MPRGINVLVITHLDDQTCPQEIEKFDLTVRTHIAREALYQALDAAGHLRALETSRRGFAVDAKFFKNAKIDGNLVNGHHLDRDAIDSLLNLQGAIEEAEVAGYVETFVELFPTNSSVAHRPFR